VGSGFFFGGRASRRSRVTPKKKPDPFWHALADAPGRVTTANLLRQLRASSAPNGKGSGFFFGVKLWGVEDGAPKKKPNPFTRFISAAA
jgi:hypothetical protein